MQSSDRTRVDRSGGAEQNAAGRAGCGRDRTARGPGRDFHPSTPAGDPVLENTESVKINFFGVWGHVPLGVALLLAAIGGALLMGIVGAARILQMRHHVKRRPRRR